MNDQFKFNILSRSKKSKSRTGIISTPHGSIKTPAFVTVGTKATVKSLTPEDLDIIGTQFVFVNTYHMVLSPTPDVVAAAGGVHAFSKIKKPIITDSGGFQVFSLAQNGKHRKIMTIRDRNVAKTLENQQNPSLVRVTDEGVEFRSPVDGTSYIFTPEFSIEAQKKIGADFIVAFDECLGLGAGEKQTARSVARTHDWAQRSLHSFSLSTNEKFFSSELASRHRVETGRSSLPPTKSVVTPHSLAQTSTFKKDFIGRQHQQLYGVIQGGMFENLRKQSAEFIAALPFWGLAIGGVSVGETKSQMREQVRWVMNVIWDDTRPRHLLGIGHIDDILDMVKMGIDTFDCVTPTRDARVGRLYTVGRNVGNERQDIVEIADNVYRAELTPVDDKCSCYTCANFTRAYLHHLFIQRELLSYRLATIHNLTFIENLFTDIRKQIEEGKL